MEQHTNKGAGSDPIEPEPGSLEGSGDSLESSETVITPSEQPIESDSTGSLISTPSPAPSRKPSFKKKLADLWHRGNLYFLVFILVVVLCLVTLFVLYSRNKNQEAPKTATINTQNLSGEALQQLANNNGLQVGDAKQVLNVQSNAVFAGTVLVRGDLQVAGAIKTGGSLNLTGLSVSGLGSFSRVQTQSLAVAGGAAFTGQLSTQGALSVGGGGNFGGPVSTPTLNTNTLQLAGNLVLNNHIQAGGARPSASGGNALGSGGTTSINGSDTAGTISINTGNNPGAGCFTTVRFTRSFSTPRVNVTPVGSAAGGIGWYVNRDGGSFSVCTSSPAPAGQSFAFDYFVVD